MFSGTVGLRGRRGEVADTPPNRMNNVGYHARMFLLGAGGEDEEDRGRGYHSLYTNKDVSLSAPGKEEGKKAILVGTCTVVF